MNTHHDFSRREFFRQSTAGLAAVAALGTASVGRAIDPIQRTGPPRLRLSLAAYSFRESLQGKDPAHPLDLFQFVDFCAANGCEGAELTSYYFPKDVDNDYLLRLKRHAFMRGVSVSGTAIGNNFTLPKGPARDKDIAAAKTWIDRAAVLGAPHIRIFAGQQGKLTIEEAKKLVIEAIEECVAYAASKGVVLGLENHHGIVAEAADLLEIVKAVNSPWFGINLDTGNFQTDDPYADLAKCAPYAVNVQFKVEVFPKGQKKQPADFARLTKIVRDAGYQGWVALEYESSESPWTAVPKHLAQMREAFAK